MLTVKSKAVFNQIKKKKNNQNIFFLATSAMYTNIYILKQNHNVSLVLKINIYIFYVLNIIYFKYLEFIFMDIRKYNDTFKH